MRKRETKNSNRPVSIEKLYSFSLKKSNALLPPFVRYLLHLRCFFKEGGIDLFPFLLCFPIVLLLALLLPVVFFFFFGLCLHSLCFCFLQITPLLAALHPCPVVPRCHDALRPFPAPHGWLFLGSIKVHIFGFFKAIYVNLHQPHPQTHPTSMLLDLPASCRSP
jgi:hypothetical protein